MTASAASSTAQCAASGRATVSVQDSPLGRAAVAARSIAAGESVLQCQGVPLAHPTRHSIFVQGQHLDPTNAVRWTNHSCDPNVALVEDWLVALRDIPAGEMISFDYERSEPHIAAPFDCACGAACCRGRIGA